MALVEPTMGLGGVEWGGVVVVVGHWEPVSTHDTKKYGKRGSEVGLLKLFSSAFGRHAWPCEEARAHMR